MAQQWHEGPYGQAPEAPGSGGRGARTGVVVAWVLVGVLLLVILGGAAMVWLFLSLGQFG